MRLAAAIGAVVLGATAATRPPEASDDLVKTVTVAFWDRYLQGERRAAGRIVEAVDGSGLATLQRESCASSSRP